VASTTLYSAICRIRRVAKYMVPDRDFGWLAEIDRELKLAAHPRSKFGRFVLAEVLLEAGLTLIREAEDSRTMTTRSRACQVRNGLMTALLALCPIRRKNFAALEIGRSFLQIKNQWWIVLSAFETKEKRADERRVPELLSPVIDCYLSQYRPVLARSGQPPKRLWLSVKNGSAITDKGVARVIRETTLSTVGMAQGPHMFRTSAESSAALHAGDNPYLGGAVLHHTDCDLTNKHYNRATTLSAVEIFRQVVRQLEKKA
jgi:site-specific recombinase XerD